MLCCVRVCSCVVASLYGTTPQDHRLRYHTTRPQTQVPHHKTTDSGTTPTHTHMHTNRHSPRLPTHSHHKYTQTHTDTHAHARTQTRWHGRWQKAKSCTHLRQSV